MHCVAAEAAIAVTGAFREGRMFVSNVPERDVLYVYERGYVDDGLEPERQLELCGHVSLMLGIDGKECVGFVFGGLAEFDFEAPENAAVWSGPRFDVPAFGIERGTVGLIGATARMVLGTLRTPDRVLFDAALSAPDPARALPLWEECLAEGNELARYALGYTLLELDRPREAHEQLRRYSALVRRNAWAWCYLGQACERLEDWEGAEYAYRQALEATAGGSFDTDAPSCSPRSSTASRPGAHGSRIHPLLHGPPRPRTPDTRHRMAHHRPARLAAPVQPGVVAD